MALHFLVESATDAVVGSLVSLTGAEAKHAAVVRRLRVGEEVTVGLDQTDVDEGVALRLDARQDRAGEAAGDAVGLDEDEGFFGGHVIHSLSESRSRSRSGFVRPVGPP